jgi:hypothetical protein
VPGRTEFFSTFLGEIVAQFGGRAPIFTTNWDTLLREAIGDAAVVITDADLWKVTELEDQGAVPIFHLHGTIEHPKITETDLMNPDSPLFRLFAAHFISKVFVLVGYSLNDINIRALYWKSLNLLKSRPDLQRKMTYVVAPVASTHEARIASALWTTRNAHLIPIPAEQFFVELRDALVSEVRLQLKREVARRLHLRDPQDIDERLRQLKNLFPDLQDETGGILFLEFLTRGSGR